MAVVKFLPKSKCALVTRKEIYKYWLENWRILSKSGEKPMNDEPRSYVRGRKKFPRVCKSSGRIFTMQLEQEIK